MRNDSVYKELYRKLTVTPTGAPSGEKFIEILKILFTPEEAELAVVLPFMPTPLAEIAAGARMSESQTERKLSKMADKGLVYGFEARGTPMYLLFSVVWTIFKFPLMSNVSDVDYDRLRLLWKEYLAEGLGGDGTPVPGEKQLPMGRVLPVQENLSPSSKVLPQDLVYSFIDEAEYISVGECSCKKTVGGCDSPSEVCMGLGHEARYLVSRNLARRIDREEAKEIHRKAVEAGLVSVTSNIKEKINLICHCCPCCCAQLGVATRHGRYDLAPQGAFYASVDQGECTACGSCVDACPMKAIEIVDTATVDLEKCIGCGLCVSACPSESIVLFAKTPPPEVPKNIMEWTEKAVQVRGVADEFVKELRVRSKK